MFDESPDVVHPEEGGEDGKRQRDRDDQDRAEMHQEDDVRECDEHNLLDQGRAQRADRLLDQIRAVVEGHDPHAFRQAGLNLGDPRLHGIDHVLGVGPGPRDDDAADSFARFP